MEIWHDQPVMRMCLALVLAVWAVTARAEDWFSRGHGREPTKDTVYVCHGYTCRIVTPVRFSPDELLRIAGGLTEVAADAAAERDNVSLAVQTFEAIVGERIGTSADLPKMQFGRGADDQMDCIDEATNTTALLMMLAKNNYLAHYKVEPPSARGFFLDLRYPHATAVLRDVETGERWAIDSWPRANAEPPVVQPLKVWKRGRGAIPEQS
jgi:hypothetical protein